MLFYCMLLLFRSISHPILLYFASNKLLFKLKLFSLSIECNSYYIKLIHFTKKGNPFTLISFYLP